MNVRSPRGLDYPDPIKEILARIYEREGVYDTANAIRREIGAPRIGQSQGPALNVGDILVCGRAQGCNVWNRAEDWSWYVTAFAPYGTTMTVTAPWRFEQPMIFVGQGFVFASDVRLYVPPPPPRLPDPRTMPRERVPSRLPVPPNPRGPVSDRVILRDAGLFLPTEVLR